MRLSISQLSGCARLAGTDFEYRIHWRWDSAPEENSGLRVSATG